ncbi:MAG: GNAT family N-acetyltransferase [bacterium]
MALRQAREYLLMHHFAPGTREWEPVIAQFSLVIQQQQGRTLANWAAERLLNLTHHSQGIVALYGDRLHGMVLYEIIEQTAEISLPWSVDADPILQCDILTEAVQEIRQQHPEVRYLRIERQLLPGTTDIAGIEAANFACHWRQRMALGLPAYLPEIPLPLGYHYAPWNVRYVDTAAELIFVANSGTLDALLYQPFFGDSTAQCRHGLLSILAGRYGALHTRATSALFHGTTLVGINLVIEEDASRAIVIEISVSPTHQGRGLGKALLTHSLRVLQNLHVETVELAVTKANTHAIRLYDSLGFTPSGDFPVCIYQGI